jgi:hypothetical protein
MEAPLMDFAELSAPDIAARTGQEIEKFKTAVYSWVQRNGLTPEQIEKNIEITKRRIYNDWQRAGIPNNYEYDLYSVYRSPVEQIQAFVDGWKAARESKHVLGKAGDIHIYKNGARLRGDQMAAFYNQYIKNRFLDFTLLYEWGFHTHWIGNGNGQGAAAGLGLGLNKNTLITVGILAAAYFLFTDKG